MARFRRIPVPPSTLIIRPTTRISRGGAGISTDRDNSGPAAAPSALAGRHLVDPVDGHGQAAHRDQGRPPDGPAGPGVDLGPVRVARVVDHRHLLTGAGDDLAAAVSR